MKSRNRIALLAASLFCLLADGAMARFVTGVDELRLCSGPNRPPAVFAREFGFLGKLIGFMNE